MRPATGSWISSRLHLRSCEKNGGNSHAAIVGLSRDIPVILGAQNATKILKSGAIVTVNGEDGVVISN